MHFQSLVEKVNAHMTYIALDCTEECRPFHLKFLECAPRTFYECMICSSFFDVKSVICRLRYLLPISLFSELHVHGSYMLHAVWYFKQRESGTLYSGLPQVSFCKSAFTFL